MIECNRCGKAFEPKQYEDGDVVVGQMIYTEAFGERYDVCIKLCALCDDCKEQLREFWHGLDRTYTVKVNATKESWEKAIEELKTRKNKEDH